ncbi:MAG: hypothetical protein U0V73_14760 [Acidimicrobiia bacterium]
MPAGDDDWRLTNQEAYLRGRRLRWSTYVGPRPDWDHDHCEFCWAKFAAADVDDEVMGEGYVNDDDERHWICSECFEDFHDRFGWIVT